MLHSPFSDDAATCPGLIELGRIEDIVPSLQLDGLTTWVVLDVIIHSCILWLFPSIIALQTCLHP